MRSGLHWQFLLVMSVFKGLHVYLYVSLPAIGGSMPSCPGDTVLSKSYHIYYYTINTVSSNSHLPIVAYF